MNAEETSLAVDILRVVQAATLMKIAVIHLFQASNSCLIKAHGLLAWFAGIELLDTFDSKIRTFLWKCGALTGNFVYVFTLCLRVYVVFALCIFFYIFFKRYCVFVYDIVFLKSPI